MDMWAGLVSYLDLRKSFTSMTFVSEWLTYAQDNRAITDDDNVFDSDKYFGFRGHRHDRTILSLLAKKLGLTVYSDLFQWGALKHRSQRILTL